MKILLDECVTKRLKPHLTEFKVFTVSEMKWNGITNGKLPSDEGPSPHHPIAPSLHHPIAPSPHRSITPSLHAEGRKPQEYQIKSMEKWRSITKLVNSDTDGYKGESNKRRNLAIDRLIERSARTSHLLL